MLRREFTINVKESAKCKKAGGFWQNVDSRKPKEKGLLFLQKTVFDLDERIEPKADGRIFCHCKTVSMETAVDPKAKNKQNKFEEAAYRA